MKRFKWFKSVVCGLVIWSFVLLGLQQRAMAATIKVCGNQSLSVTFQCGGQTITCTFNTGQYCPPGKKLCALYPDIVEHAEYCCDIYNKRLRPYWGFVLRP